MSWRRWVSAVLGSHLLPAISWRHQSCMTRQSEEYLNVMRPWLSTAHPQPPPTRSSVGGALRQVTRPSMCQLTTREPFKCILEFAALSHHLCIRPPQRT
jgi:hypothetical protein